MTSDRSLVRAGLAALAAVALLAPLTAGAQTAQEVLERVRKKYDSITDARISFTQDVRIPTAGIAQSADGTLEIKKVNKYRVDMGDQTIVTDGVTVWSYAEATQQVLVDDFKLQERSLSPERLLTATPDEYSAVLVGREKLGKTPTIVVKLTPRDEMSIVRTLKLWVREEDWLVRKVELIDLGGKETTYTVKDAAVNIGLDDGRFVFTPPQGVEIVDLR